MNIEKIINFLIKENKFPQSILIEGQDKNYLFDISLKLAEQLLDTKFKINEESFETLYFHPDLKIIAPEKSIKIEQIRLLNEFCYLTPHKSKNKLIIIKDAEKMTIEAANALLKILEEPLENRFFILLTENKNKLLLTIVSRCIYFKANIVKNDYIDKDLPNKQIMNELTNIYQNVESENFSFFYINNLLLENIEKNFNKSFEEFLKTSVNLNINILDRSDTLEKYRINIVDSLLNILRSLKYNINYKYLTSLFSLYLKEKKFKKGVLNFG